MTEARNVDVYRVGADGKRLGRLGSATRKPDGWKFVPAVFGKAPSTKRYPTWEESLPRWVGYPDACETEVAS